MLIKVRHVVRITRRLEWDAKKHLAHKCYLEQGDSVKQTSRRV